MPGAGPVGHTQVGRDADQADIDAFDLANGARMNVAISVYRGSFIGS
jgi:hypothetical protein